MQQTVGPTLIDLKQRMNVNYEDIATAVSGSSAGYFIGGLIGGAIVDKLSSLCDLLVALCLDGMAVVTIAIPWSHWTQLLWVLCCLQGIFAAVLNTGNFPHHFTVKVLSLVTFMGGVLLTKFAFCFTLNRRNIDAKR